MATKNDDSESNLSVEVTDKKDRLHVALEQRIAIATRPARNVLLFFAMCVHMHDLDAKPLAVARRWLELYDDESRDYKLLRRKGLEMSDL